jgi:hypothetical protein
MERTISTSPLFMEKYMGLEKIHKLENLGKLKLALPFLRLYNWLFPEAQGGLRWRGVQVSG